MTERISKKKLLDKIKYLNEGDQEKIAIAYDFAKKAHGKQKRLSGESYISHPTQVAISLAELNSDAETIIAGLLHDTIEDTDVSHEGIKKEFGSTVANLVEGVTKISQIKNKNDVLKIKYFHDFSDQIDNYRKLLAAMAGDPRIIIIKLNDRLHNIQTLSWLKKNKRTFYALETIEIYGAIAQRLGMGEIYGQLVDLSFPYAYPDDYKRFIKLVRPVQKLRSKNVNRIINEIRDLLKDHSAIIDINGRIKRDYSLFKKMVVGERKLEDIYDLVAVRIIVQDVSECYKVLGLIHSNYQPIESKITDYIAKPKENGYQSLHTVVKRSDWPLEIQIRTLEMHQNAEYGIAAHWKYKNSQYNNYKNTNSQLTWLSEINQSISNGYKLDKGRKFFSSKVFVFSPNGQIFELPNGSTPVDFAFMVHTEIGLSCSGAKINNQLKPLNTKLATGDIVEIIKSEKQQPSRDWLNFVKTNLAKSKIKSYFLSEDRPRLIKNGRKKINNELTKLNLPQLSESQNNLFSLRLYQSKLPFSNINSALIAVAKGNLSVVDLLKVIFNDPNIAREEKVSKSSLNSSVILSVGSGIPYRLARCCKPKVTDKIIGYLTLQQKITIHRHNCSEVSKFSPERIISAKWS